MNKYMDKYFSEELREKEAMSKKESESLTDRPVRCPHCMVPIFFVYSDVPSGHFRVKCTRCRQISWIDLGRFYRSKESKPFPGIDMLPPFVD